MAKQQVSHAPLMWFLSLLAIAGVWFVLTGMLDAEKKKFDIQLKR